MKIHSPFLTGSIQAKPSFINGIVVEGGITGSLQGTASYATVAQSVVGGGEGDVPAGTVSGSTQIVELGFLQTSSYQIDSASFDTRIDNINVDTSSLLQSTEFYSFTESYQTDSSSFDTRIDSLESSGAPAGTVSGSTQIVELGFLQTSSYQIDSASFDERIDTIVVTTAETASYVNPLNQTVQITGSLLISGSNGAGVFSKGGTIVDLANGIDSSGSYYVWRAPFPAEVLAVYGRRTGGGNSVINAVKESSGTYTTHLAENLTLSTPDEWTGNASVQNALYGVGDSLEIIITGSNAVQVAVQVDFRKR